MHFLLRAADLGAMQVLGLVLEVTLLLGLKSL